MSKSNDFQYIQNGGKKTQAQIFNFGSGSKLCDCGIVITTEYKPIIICVTSTEFEKKKKFRYKIEDNKKNHEEIEISKQEKVWIKA